MTRSRTDVTGRTRRVRLARAIGPEPVAAALCLVVVLIVGANLVSRPAAVDSRPSSSPAARPAEASPPAVVPGTRGSAGPSVTLPPTMASWAGDARILLEADRRLADARDRLVVAIGDDAAPVGEIARELRAMNTQLSAAIALIDGIERGGAPPSLVADLRAVHQATVATNLETLQASLQNAAAYRAGAKEVVTILADLDDLMARTADEAGLPSADPS